MRPTICTAVIAATAGMYAVMPGAAQTDAPQSIIVASYYFGNYPPGDPRNTKMKGKDWSEWELVKAAIVTAFWSHWICQGLYVLVALIWLVPDPRIEKALTERRA